VLVLRAFGRMMQGVTYWGFHLRFNLPVLLLLAVVAPERTWHPQALGVLAGLLVVVMVFTSPWDNWAARCGIWGFAEGKYWRKVGYLPVEEYAFFIIQSLEAVLLAAVALTLLGPFHTPDHPWSGSLQAVVLAAGALLWAGIGWWGRGIGRDSSAHYAWHLFYWFIPVIAAQWVIGWPILVERWPVLLLVTLVLGTYLSVADWVAIRHGIWYFDKRQTTGWNIGSSMPWEEAAFFYLTSLLVAQSYLVLLPEALRS
jgi:putative membrane protein